MHRIHRAAWGLIGAVAIFAIGGCSAIVKSSVDTQPRVELADSAYESPAEIVHGKPIAYWEAPAAAANGIDPDLVQWAPMIVQGEQPDGERADYERTADELGWPTLSSDGERVNIDVARPVVFARVEHAVVDEESLKQLVYAFWYPERPVGTIETGSVDGGILRLTLGADGVPGVIEYSQPCGCFHGVFVAEHVEQAAKEEYEALAKDRRYAVEPAITGDEDWVVRDLVQVEPGDRPVLYVSAGRHFCEAIRFQPVDAARGRAAESRPYTLQPYESLTAIPREGGGAGSMFRPDGLVIGGKRWKEEIMLSDLDNPGWPRRLDRMLIHWDHDRWTDETLLQRHLRLPSSFVRPGAVAPSRASADAGAASSGKDGQGARASASSAAHDERTSDEPELILFTNRYCLGCQAVEHDVLPDPAVQIELAHWRFRIIDTATPEGAAIATRRHVSVTPVVIGFDQAGREVLRSEDIETPSKLINVLEQGSASS